MPNIAHKPNAKLRNAVEALACVGATHDRIAKYIGIDKVTMYKYYRKELDLGKDSMHAKAMGTLSTAIDEGGKTGVTAAMFWLKTQAGFRETNRKEISGPDGGPVESKSAVTITFVDPKPDTDD